MLRISIEIKTTVKTKFIPFFCCEPVTLPPLEKMNDNPRDANALKVVQYWMKSPHIFPTLHEEKVLWGYYVELYLCLCLQLCSVPELLVNPINCPTT